jgi:magnesium transporter
MADMRADRGLGTPLDASFEAAVAQATTRVPAAAPDELVGAVLARLPGRRFDSAGHIVVTQGDRPVGLLRHEVALAAAPEALVAELMDPDPPTVRPGDGERREAGAAWQAANHEESALLVVDKAGSFQGLVPPQRLLAVLLATHAADTARLQRYLKGTAEARSASLEPVQRRFRHRMPWLLVGLAGALLAALIVGRYEAELEATVMLAFFIPSIVYLADAVGTQTETVAIRGLSAGVGLRHMARRELSAGLVIGAALGAVALPLVWWLWGDAEVALTVGLAVFAACGTATVAAMALPAVLRRSGRDPAFASGPLATVIQDLASILIYFAIARLIIG